MRNFWDNLQAHNGVYHSITTKNHVKMLDFWCTLSMRNDGIWYNESHPLLMKYFKTLLEYLYKNDDVYEGICKPLWCHAGPQLSQFIAKHSHWLQPFEVTLTPANGVARDKESHPLHVGWSRIFLNSLCSTISNHPEFHGIHDDATQWTARLHDVIPFIP